MKNEASQMCSVQVNENLEQKILVHEKMNQSKCVKLFGLKPFVAGRNAHLSESQSVTVFINQFGNTVKFHKLLVNEKMNPIK